MPIRYTANDESILKGWVIMHLLYSIILYIWQNLWQQSWSNFYLLNNKLLSHGAQYNIANILQFIRVKHEEQVTNLQWDHILIYH